MRKSIILLVVFALLAGIGLMSCKNEVATQDTLSEVCISLSESRNVIGTVTSSIPPVSDLYWYYVATKNDKGLYATGATPWKAVQEEKGLTEGTLLGLFSQGKWKFSFYGFMASDVPALEPGSVPSAAQLEKAVYYAEGIEVVVNNATATVDIALTVGTIMDGKVVLSDLTFDLTHVASDVQFNADAEGSFKLLFKNGSDVIRQSGSVVYDSGETDYAFTFETPIIENIADGAYTYTFEVVFTDGENNSIVVATEDVGVTISKGVIVTFDGDVFYSDPVDEVVIGEITGEKQATASFTVTSGKSVTVSAAVSPASAASTAAIASTSVEIPADALSTEGEYLMNIDVTEAGLPYEAAGVDHGKTVAAQIDLSLFFDDVPVTNFDEVVKVTTYIAKNLTEVILKYDGNAYTRYNSEIATGSAEKDHYFYNPTDGKLVIYTDHFSNYYVDSADEAVNLTTNKAYKTLVDAVKDTELNEGDTIRLLKDITYTDAAVNAARYEINKSVTIDGNGKTIVDTYQRTFRFGYSHSVSDVTIKNLTVENKTTLSAASMTVVIIDVSTLNMEGVTLKSRLGNSSQPLTVSNVGAVPTINLVNCTIGDENAYYSIILWKHVTLNISGGSITGWSPLYFKPGSADSTVTISNCSLNSKGKGGSSWNNFGMINFENGQTGGVVVDISNSDLVIETEATDSYQSLVSFSAWYGPNTGGCISITGGSVKLIGSHAIFVIDNGAENELTIVDSAIDYNGEKSTSYSYESAELENFVAYMYKNGEATICAGFKELNSYIAMSNGSAPNYIFEDGEWFELYTDVALSANAVFNVRGSGSRSFGIILGDHSMSGGDYKLTIPADVTIKTDKSLSGLFAAESGEVVETPVEEGSYRYAYSVSEIQ